MGALDERIKLAKARSKHAVFDNDTAIEKDLAALCSVASDALRPIEKASAAVGASSEL